MTVEPTPTLSAEDAYRLTQRIRTAASGAREAMETLSVCRSRSPRCAVR